MEVKTITSARSEGPAAFDKQINEALEEGFQLVKRGMLPAVAVAGVHYHPQYYAEMVKLDGQKGGEFQNVLGALKIVQSFCNGHMCGDSCPLDSFCAKHFENDGPTDWEIPDGVQDDDPA